MIVSTEKTVVEFSTCVVSYPMQKKDRLLYSDVLIGQFILFCDFCWGEFSINVYLFVMFYWQIPTYLEKEQNFKYRFQWTFWTFTLKEAYDWLRIH